MPTPPNYDGPHSKHTNVKEGEVGSKVGSQMLTRD